MKILKILITGMIFIGTSIVSLAVTSISPIYFNQRIDKNGGYQEYEIENDSYDTVRYKVEVLPEVGDKEEFKRMKKWVEIYPKVLVVKPKSSGKVKVMIKADNNAKKGEYNFTLTPTPIVIPKIEERKNQENVALIKAKAPLVLSMGIDGYVGDFGDVTERIIVSKKENRITIKNTLDRRVVLDMLVNERINTWRDNVTLEKGQEIIEEFDKETKFVTISEAATGIKIDKVSF